MISRIWYSWPSICYRVGMYRGRIGHQSIHKYRLSYGCRSAMRVAVFAAVISVSRQRSLGGPELWWLGWVAVTKEYGHADTRNVSSRNCLHYSCRLLNCARTVPSRYDCDGRQQQCVAGKKNMSIAASIRSSTIGLCNIIKHRNANICIYGMWRISCLSFYWTFGHQHCRPLTEWSYNTEYRHALVDSATFCW